MFEILQSRFKVLREKIRMWFLHEIFKVSQTCVVLYNVIISMQQAGECTDNVQEEKGKVKKLTQIYDLEHRKHIKCR